MKFSFTLSLLSLLFLPFSFASPTPEDGLNKRADNVTGLYYLKTKVLNGGDLHKDGLYVWAYHTGAGINDAVLGDKRHALKGYLNNTYQVFDLGTNFPWSFYLPADTNYAGWELVSINAGYATSGLFVNGTQLQWTAYDSFGGWLVCDWWHGIPQLFWKVDYLNYPITSCAAVELITEETTGSA